LRVRGWTFPHVPHAQEIVAAHRALLDACRHRDLDRFAALLQDHISDSPTPRFGLA
jgi:DNA-binding GntR family transcriptional regulator